MSSPFRSRRESGTPTKDYSFDLPPELIAAYPPTHRLNARLMVIDRTKGRWSHHRFSDLRELLRPQDFLVLNNSKVLPVALESVDGQLTALLVEETSPRHWTALVKPGKAAKPGMRVEFKSRPGHLPLAAEVLKTLESGERVFRFFDEVDFEKLGEMPLPPYILKRRQILETGTGTRPEIDDRLRYQTVYAATPGSVAAPTAGLHFTQEFLAKFPHAFVTLHVGLGTFRPVKTETIEDHEMHAERFSIPEGLAAAVTTAQAAGGRLIAVGTTSARVLESVRTLERHGGLTQIFIYPPYTFRHVEGLLTNFHLPGSTLLMLVSALAGRELILAAYAEAIREKYRFFSYGDAMLIL